MRSFISLGIFLSLCVAVSVCFAERRVAPEPVVRPVENADRHDKGAAHLGEQEWEQAAGYFEQIVQADPSDGRAWYQLGYSSLLLGKHEHAIDCWDRSGAIGFLAPESRYNQACTYAILQQPDRALSALEESVRLGYRDFEAMSKDTDLESLREFPRYQALVKPKPYPKSAGGAPVEFSSEGGWSVFGHLYTAKTSDPKTAPTLLLFHQAGSNHAEYFPIAPKLAEAGYNCLAIDARGGGDAYGRSNQTIAPHEERGGGEEAHLDFRAALQFLDTHGYTGNRALWGSSYSAGRLFALLTEKPERVVAGLAFSPGRTFARAGENGEPAWASQVSVPIFVAMPVWEFDQSAESRFETIAVDDRWLYVPTKGGAHGSAMLRPDRNPDGFEAAWKETELFLREFVR